MAGVHASNGRGWLRLRFDRPYFVVKILIYYRFYTNWFNPQEGCVKSEANFKSCIDNDGNVDVSVYQGEVQQKSCGTLQLTFGLEQSDQIYTLICNAVGDTVILNKEASGNFAVSEVVVVTNIGKFNIDSSSS